MKLRSLLATLVAFVLIPIAMPVAGCGELVGIGEVHLSPADGGGALDATLLDGGFDSGGNVADSQAPSDDGGCSGTDLQADKKNCGACGNDCTLAANVLPLTTTCVNGSCVYACARGYSDSCPGGAGAGCTTSLSTRSNCGACGNECAGSAPLCSAPADGGAASCVSSCAPGTTLCGTSCVDDQTDPTACGPTCAVCADVCAAGVCTLCTPGAARCDPTTDAPETCNNGGTAWQLPSPCASGETCQNGSCTCASALCGTVCCEWGQICTNDACAVPVTSAAAATLQLWLSADYGLECSGGTATGWLDRSGTANNATTTSNVPGPSGTAIGSHSGPSCNVSGHTINGIAVPYFPDPADGPPYVNGTFDVDFGFLVNNPQFTIFVVERRWGPPRASGADELFLGTETGGTDTIATSSSPKDATLQVGYVSYNGCEQLSIDLGGDGAQNTVPVATAGIPSTLLIDTFRSSASSSLLQVWVNGFLQTGDHSYAAFPSAYATQLAEGSIGRALDVNYSDQRFNGDIAEVLFFDSALTETDRQSVEAYLEAHWGGVTNLGTGGNCP